MIIELPRLFAVESRSFRLRPFSLSSQGILDGERNAHLVQQRWVANLTFTTQEERDWRHMEGLVASLGGISGKLRARDPANLEPYYNIDLAKQIAMWDDGATWSGGAGWLEGHLPPHVAVNVKAHRGAAYMIMSGFPASLSQVLRYGDKFEVRPDGEPATTGHLYQVTAVCNSDADGLCGVSFRPGLRETVIPGDQIVLKEPTSVFHLATDDEGEIPVSAPIIGRASLRLVEALRGVGD